MATTYQDLWDLHKATDELHNGSASIYEQHEGDSEDPLSPEDLASMKEIVKETLPALTSFGQEDELDDVLASAHEQVGEAVEERLEREDGVVRIVLNIPAHHLSEAQREKLEKDVVREAAIYSKMWMDALEFGGESLVMNDKLEPEDIDTDSEDEEGDEYEQEVQEAEEGVELPPEEVMTDIAQKWRETYEQMRPDYHEHEEMELETAVLECLIEDGYILPGPHYNVETETARTVGGDKTTFVTGPKGSKTVKGKS